MELDAKSGGLGLIDRASELASSLSPWRFTAKEVVALSALKTGNIKTARSQYKELSMEAAAPQGLQTRAQNMLDMLAN